MILLYNHQFHHQETHTQSIMTPVTRQPASIHVASHTSRYDYLNAAKKNLPTTEQQQQKQEQDYDQECFEENGDACVSARRTTRNSKVKQQQQQQQPAPSKKTVAFAQPAPAPAQQQKHEEQPTGKRVSKRQAAKYDAHNEAVEAANILASLAAAAAAAAGPKERTPPYWTRQHEKAKSSARLQKAMSSVLQCD
jgi:hypothetical protein